jgi:hypothetical protein
MWSSLPCIEDTRIISGRLASHVRAWQCTPEAKHQFHFQASQLRAHQEKCCEEKFLRSSANKVNFGSSLCVVERLFFEVFGLHWALLTSLEYCLQSDSTTVFFSAVAALLWKKTFVAYKLSKAD